MADRLADALPCLLGVAELLSCRQRALYSDIKNWSSHLQQTNAGRQQRGHGQREACQATHMTYYTEFRCVLGV